ncbi:MAG TPA: DedA family protein [Gaiellaceae bacterium]|nr:DedA family protein [Gaiellaceae bacterium]
MFSDLLNLVTASPWTYALIVGVAAFDALFPLVPSEATVITAGVLAGLGELSIALVIATGAAGAFMGDTTAYAVGRVSGNRFECRLARSPRVARRLDWAGSALARRGGLIIFAARFIPGGRTAVTVTAGLTRMRALIFAVYAGLAAIAWASYAALLGYFGGRTFEERPALALAVGFGLAATVAVLIEATRRLRRS